MMPPSFERSLLHRVGPIGCAALVGLLGSCGSGPVGPPTGVLLISIDSLRADHLSCYGYESATKPGRDTTPFIDATFAGEGTRFANAYSTTSWTLPAHMALLTGRPNEVHGVLDAPWQLNDEVQPYLPKLFRSAGWTTFGIWSGPNLHPYFGFAHGFDAYVDCSQVPAKIESFDVVDGEDWSALGQTHNLSHTAVTGPKIVDTFLDWFDGIGPKERFFAFVHMWDVHYDYNAPKAYDVFYPGYAGTIDGQNLRDLNNKVDSRPPSADDILRLKSLYDSEILYTDKNIETMVSALEAAGRLDSTLIVLVADHGEEFLEHGNFGHKLNVYEESVRIPFIVRYPGMVRSKQVVQEVASIVDVAPTILDLAEVAGRQDMWGRSLRGPLTTGEVLPERLAPLELTFRNDMWFRGARGQTEKAVQVGQSLRARWAPYELRDKYEALDLEYVSGKFPELEFGIFELEQGAIERRPSRLLMRHKRSIPKLWHEIAVDANDPFGRRVLRLWATIDETSKEYAKLRRRGEIDESLLQALEAAGYAQESGEEDAASHGAAGTPSGEEGGSSAATTPAGASGEKGGE